MHIQESTFYIPNKKIITERKLLRKIIRGNEYLYQKEREFNYGKGKRGYQIKLFDKDFTWNHNEYLKRFCFENENDVIDFHIEITEPNFDWYKYNIDPDNIDKILLLLTQALTSGAGSTQQFNVPDTWGPNTSSAIGGGGNGASGAISGTTTRGGGAGGGGAFASGDVETLNRNSTANYFCGAATQSSWFGNTGLLLADGGNSGSGINGGNGGLASNSIGTIKRNGGTGGDGGTTTATLAIASSGGGAGSAAGTSSVGQTGSNGNTDSSGGSASANGGKGANSDTAIGPNGTTGNGATGTTGTDFDASHGAGSGAAGGGANTSGLTGGNGGLGGLYGGGGGGSGAQNTSGGDIGAIGAGRQGMIFLSWVPYQYTEVYQTN